MSVQPQEVEPSSGQLIVGLVAIGEMFDRHRETISRWVRTEGFPAAKMPNGEYITSPTLVDEWLRARCQAQGERSGSTQGVSEV